MLRIGLRILGRHGWSSQLFLKALRSYTDAGNGHLREILDSTPRPWTPCERS
jgi:hypothetical protein